MPHLIISFETWQSKDGKPRDATLKAFIDRYCTQAEIKPPPLAASKGELQARINQGRWLVDCPVPGCGNAIIASYREPFFWCWNCGNQGNDKLSSAC